MTSSCRAESDAGPGDSSAVTVSGIAGEPLTELATLAMVDVRVSDLPMLFVRSRRKPESVRSTVRLCTTRL